MSNNLDISQLLAAQTDKVTTINDANGELDASLTEIETVPIDNTNAVTLTNDQIRRNLAIVFADDVSAPTATCTATVPAIRCGLFIVRNTVTTHAVNVEISGQSEVSPQVASGGLKLLFSDGANIFEL